MPSYLIRLASKRKGNKFSNEDWASKTDPDARIAKMKDGSAHLACKPGHAADLATGVIVAAPIHAADEGDTAMLYPRRKKHRRRSTEEPVRRGPCSGAGG